MTGKTSLSIAVMTHPRRLVHAQKLATELSPHPVDIVLDPVPEGPPQSLRTAVRAWAAAGDASHHLVLQDDVVVIDGFVDNVLQHLQEFPEAALAYFAQWSSCNGMAVRLGALVNARWVEAIPEWTPCQALVLPRRLALGFTEFGLSHHPQPCDELMQLFLTSKGVPTYLSVPSLADHAPLPSLLGHDPKGARKAACFQQGPPTQPPNRTDPPATFRAIPYFFGGRTLCSLPDPSPTTPYRRTWTETISYLTSLGVSIHRVRHELQHALAKANHETRAAGTQLGKQTLSQLWITTYAMGCIAAQHYRPIPEHNGDTQLNQPHITENAMATIAVGSLTHIPNQPTAEWLSWQLRHLCHAGFTAGTTDPAITKPLRHLLQTSQRPRGSSNIREIRKRLSENGACL